MQFPSDCFSPLINKDYKMIDDMYIVMMCVTWHNKNDNVNMIPIQRKYKMVGIYVAFKNVNMQTASNGQISIWFQDITICAQVEFAKPKIKSNPYWLIDSIQFTFSALSKANCISLLWHSLFAIHTYTPHHLLINISSEIDIMTPKGINKYSIITRNHCILMFDMCVPFPKLINSLIS